MRQPGNQRRIWRVVDMLYSTFMNRTQICQGLQTGLKKTATYPSPIIAKLLRPDPPACLRENFAAPEKKSRAALA